MPLEDAAFRALARPTLPPGFVRLRLVLSPGAIYPSDADEWRGCVVVVESGHVDVHCTEGGHKSFRTGDVLTLDWLPLASLCNPGDVEARLLAVRRSIQPSGYDSNR